MPVTWWRRCATTGAPARSAPHPRQASGGQGIVSSGSSTRFMVDPGSPGCLPGCRFPRSRSDRSRPFFLYGLSEDGGLDDVEESLPACRSSCSTRAASCSFRAASSPISRYASASRAASSAAGRADSSSALGIPGAAGTPRNDHYPGQLIKHPPRRVASHHAQPSRRSHSLTGKRLTHVNSSRSPDSSGIM